jgi:uncharacterized protein YfaP (DUF2135 family)
MAAQANRKMRSHVRALLMSDELMAKERWLLHWFAIAILAALTLVALSHTARAAEPSLGGSWSGGGWVNFASGSRERARCRAHYTANSANSYSVHATCATASGSVSQSATVRRTGARSFSGSFFNSQFNVSGTIHVTLHGNSQSVTLSSGSGSASLSLSKG